MSVNLLLDDTGKIASQYINASGIIPTNPDFESVTVTPNPPGTASVALNNGSGGAAVFFKDAAGYARLSNGTETALEEFLGADEALTQVTVRGTQIAFAEPTGTGFPIVQLIGGSGAGQVYDRTYNPAVKQLANPTPLQWAQNIQNNPGAGINNPIDIDFIAPYTGYYMLTNTLGTLSSVALNTQIDPDGIIEGYVSVSPSGGPTGVFVAGSGFIWNCSLGAQSSSFTSAIEPLEWTQNCIMKLNEGVQYNLYIAGYRNTAPTGVFNLACFGEIVQMC